MGREEHSRLGYLDTWRCFAVSLVIINHATWTRGLRWPAIGDIGTAGVHIFFFISGFVVSRIALKEIRETGGFSVGAFYIRRAFRILPPLAFYLLTCTLLTLSGLIDMPLADLIPAVLFLCNSALFPFHWYTAALWSLAYEEQFYVIFPSIATWSSTGIVRKMSTFIVWTVISMPVFALGSTRTRFVMVYGLFLAGYFCAKTTAWNRYMTKPNLLFLLGAGVTFFPPQWLSSDLAVKYFKFSYVLAVPLMILASGRPEFFLRKPLENRVVQYLGRASYSIYLWQQLFTSPAAAALPWPVQLALSAAAIALLLALFEYAERPLIAYSHKLSMWFKARPASPFPAVRNQALDQAGS